MRLELLYVDSCAGHARLLPVVRALAAEYGAELEERRIEDARTAGSERFLGSPTVRVNGVDVEPGAEARTDFGLTCLLYRPPHGDGGVPAQALIERALRS